MHDVAEIALACRLNNDVEMVKQKNVSQHYEWMNLLYIVENFAQQTHILRVTKNRFAILHNLSDKNRRARDIITAKVHKQIIQQVCSHA